MVDNLFGQDFMEIDEVAKWWRILRKKKVDGKMGGRVLIHNPITSQDEEYILEGFKKDGNERGEPIMILRIPDTILYCTYHINYLK